MIRPVPLLGRECRVTASIGISMHPDDGRDESTLMAHADVAMYQAKEAGKNTFQFTMYQKAAGLGNPGPVSFEVTAVVVFVMVAGVAAWIGYQSREEEGTQTPVQTLTRGWGSCPCGRARRRLAEPRRRRRR